ncbi:GntR family transcriptional regulator [Paucilactobacillus wasatchensis]|uniref:Transcriptional regulator, GntR family n=1 Tax=Paucilactobacillus wasatchensis TaxID=1335616 RepID=A0A0D0Y7I3_9LACO|nr:GntR family transcriptional regulator [Paucilactobacillus wasatchensis]KIS04228.1 Transcriptional regulator, GntR family [Paucilactobacillus wasatchensis]
MEFNFNSTEPLYQQVAEQLEEAIFTGSFTEDKQIPSTTEISKQFHINPATVLKGMNLLVAKELIEKRRGIGMFVKVGAVATIEQQRKESFYADYILNVVTEAQKLGLTEEKLVQLIERGYQNGTN